MGLREVFWSYERVVSEDLRTLGDQFGGGSRVFPGILQGRGVGVEMQLLSAVPSAGGGAWDGAAQRSERAHAAASRPSGRVGGVHGWQMASNQPAAGRAGDQRW